jgi:hypothetical protein
MKQCFVPKNFGADRKATIDTANSIIATYQAQGYRLTLRQLYYQFVSKDLIQNTERSYKNLGATISDGRLAGLIDWDAIEDRVRVPKVPLEFSSVEHLVNSATSWYRLPRWDGQENYVELWVEKDALAGVLQPIAHEFHVTLMVNRGYSSQSAMFESARRFQGSGHGMAKHLLYLGDHDPSGEDMVRDVGDRLEMFGVAALRVKKLALTMGQVEQYQPPPNPAKLSDSRAAKYVDKHGDQSWEVDALPPNVLGEIIRTELQTLVDQDKVDAVVERENVHKRQLAKAARAIENGEFGGAEEKED